MGGEMRHRSWHKLLLSSSLLAFLAATLAGCANMSEPRIWDGCAIGGGVLGAFIGGGTAAGITLGEGTSNGVKVGASLGAAAGGAILGAIIGHYYCDPLIAPPPPVMAQAPPPPPPPPPPPAPQERIVLRGVHFDFNKSRIRPDAAPILDEAADILKQHSDVTVNVNGYCDIIGGMRYNLRLSQRRAEAVVRYLENRGIAGDRLIPHGYGKTDFVATNATAEGRAQNRRVELVPTGQ
jgi:outer membrane protein OmpA-like peptidoglycan-associated protein